VRARGQVLSGVLSSMLVFGLALPVGAQASPMVVAAAPTVAVDGQVSAPATYTLAQLAAVTQTAVTLTVGPFQLVEKGVLLETLVSLAQPAYPLLVNAKNRLLRVTVTVRGAVGGPVTFAVGELDPNFGDHPALLALQANGATLPGGPELVVPGDTAPLRFIAGVREVTVGIATAPATAPPVTGTVTVHTGSRQIALPPALLALLPRRTLTVSFVGPGGTQTHTEQGPPLLEVLALTGAPLGLNARATAVGSDNYVATVTPAEAYAGGRPLLLSLVEDGVPLAQPRLVTDGDVKGGRYVSGMVDIYAGSGPAT
jgi:hypothetical protein